jgi:hypothetical protein
VQAALLSGLLVTAALGASACGGARDTGAGPGVSPTATTSPTAGGHELRLGPPRTPDAVLKRISGRRIEAAGQTIRVDASTVTCGGLGRPSQRDQANLSWTRFRCIQPTFPPGSVAGPDLIFVVQSVAPHDLVVTRRRFTSY